MLATKAARKHKKRTGNISGGGGGGGFGKSSGGDDPDDDILGGSSTNDDELAIYTRYFRDERKKLPRHKRSSIVQISSSPLMFTVDEFIDPQACARVETKEEALQLGLHFQQRVAKLLFNGQTGAMDGLRFNDASSEDSNNNNTTFPDGLHMDTNNECIFRHVTAILYLNDVPSTCGGATMFPLARTLPHDPTVTASQRLLAERIPHTRSCGTVRRSGIRREADGQLLETRVGSDFLANPDMETAIRVQPQAGRLLLFFSRSADGQEDPRAWHGGERLMCDNNGKATEKRILTLFKQVDYGTNNYPSPAESTFEAYLSPQIREQQQWLQTQVG
jgi:hypothetical protein